MKTRILQKVTLAALVATSLSGCESLDTNELIGAATGALGCAAISKISGGSDREIAAAALVCGTVGYAVTNKLESERKKHASNEDFYQSEVARLQDYENKLNQQIRISKSKLAASQAAIDRAAGKAEWTDIELAELRSLNSDLTGRQSALSQELSVAKENLEYQKGVNLHMKSYTGSVDPGAEQQLAELESSVAELESLVGEHELQTAALGSYL